MLARLQAQCGGEKSNRRLEVAVPGEATGRRCPAVGAAPSASAPAALGRQPVRPAAAENAATARIEALPASVALKAMPASDRPWVAASYVLLHLKLLGWGVLVLGSLLGFGLAGPARRSRLARVVIYGVVAPFAPLVFLAGLMVAAVGQQPWLVHGLMRLGDGFVAWSGVVVVGAVGVLGMAVAAGVLFRRLRSIDRA